MAQRFHTLKIRENYYWALECGDKKAEVRLNDRDFQKGDYIDFSIIWDDPTAPTDANFRPQRYRITHILTFPEGLRDGYVVLSISKTKA